VGAARALRRRGALCRWRASGVEAVCAQFGRLTLAGVAVRRGPASAGIVAGHAAGPRASLGAESRDGSAELALDRTGAWRAEAVVRRGAAGSPWLVRARAGHRGGAAHLEPNRGRARAARVGDGGRGAGERRGAAGTVGVGLGRHRGRAGG
jgi:hypothetical protein